MIARLLLVLTLGISASVRAQSLPADAKLKFEKIEVEDKPGSPLTVTARMAWLAKEKPAVSDVTVMSYFYDKSPDGSIELSKAQVSPKWVSAPIDWNEAEELVLSRPRDEHSVSAGFVIGVYYQGRLQDFRISPETLAGNIPLPAEINPMGGPPSPEKIFGQVNEGYKRAAEAFRNKNKAVALQIFERVEGNLITLQKNHPDWQPDAVSQRLADVRRLIKDIKGN